MPKRNWAEKRFKPHPDEPPNIVATGAQAEFCKQLVPAKAADQTPSLIAEKSPISNALEFSEVSFGASNDSYIREGKKIYVMGRHALQKAGKRRRYMTEQCLWKITDVAKYLGIPLNSVYKMTGPKSAIRIPHIRISGKVRFRKADIDQWLDQQMVSTNNLLASLRKNIDGKTYQN